MNLSFNRLLVLLLSLAAASAATAGEIDFNRDIRPILSDNCFRCHGPDEENREADLRLDVRESAIAAGAIDSDALESSELLARITASDPDLMMPPPSTEKSISQHELKLLKQWIGEGASYEKHWAFSPPTRPPLPDVIRSDWIRNPIDHFVADRHTEHDLQPSEVADRQTLIRRLYLDLIGLPPTPRQVDAFLSDERENAYQILIDQLLDSQHFGQRWGRWWLDAARYADSDGYEKDKPRSVWFYRDWVIDAMNRDLPYNDFIVQQIAGDLLPNHGQNELVATGFLRNSMVNEEGGADPEQFRVEGMFDRMDAIGKAILGVTTQCAQCHTHKYDPLSQLEYYQMFAALNDFHEATATAFTPQQQAQRQRVEQGIAELEDKIKLRIPDWRQQLLSWADEQTEQQIAWTTVVPTDRPYEGQKFRPLDDGSIVSESYAPTRTTNTFSLTIDVDRITAFRIDALTHPQLPRGGPGRSIFGTGALSEFEVTIAPLDKPANKQQLQWARAMSDVNPPRSELPLVYRDRDPVKDDRVTGGIEFAIDGDVKTAWSTDIGPGRRNQDRHAIFIPQSPVEPGAAVVLSLTLKQMHGGWNSDDNQNYLLGRYRFSITDSESIPDSTLPADVQAALRVAPAQRTAAHQASLFRYWRTTRQELADVNDEIERLWQSFPESDSQLVVEALETPRMTHVMKRGDFLNLGEQVSPAGPAFLNPMPKTDQPARLRFAQWLVADEAPTTARVIVNRIWQNYFGLGIVTTPEDFGYQSSPPSHPDLLDWLAVELMDHDWHLKHIHRLIVNSATYRQSSRMTSALADQDPQNVWLARGARHRVDAESVRDIALAASGLLSEEAGGPSVYPPAPEFLFQPPASYGPKQWNLSSGRDQYRRSVYVHRYRSVPYPTLQVFDAPKGDAACVRRVRSNTPLQALVMLNETQFVQCARAMAGRVMRESRVSDDQRIDYAMQLCVSRRPNQQEREVLTELLQQQRERIAAGEVDLESLVGASPATYRQLTGTEASEFAPWIVVCRAVLNLDETITKP